MRPINRKSELINEIDSITQINFRIPCIAFVDILKSRDDLSHMGQK